MNSISVVLIAKNEAHIIADTIRSVQSLTDDIIVVDSGSTDGTQAIVQGLSATLIQSEWEGFGPTKNKGISAAKYNWILSIDADELADEALVKTLKKLELSRPENVYKIKFKTYLGNKLIRFGEWGKDAHIRLFNRNNVQWNNAKVHEQLVLPAGTVVLHVTGYLLHYSMKDMSDYSTKMTGYALLNAERYFYEGRNASWIKRYIAPSFSFVKHYLFQLGFLDGREGYIIAKMTCYYTFLKYARLHELRRASTV